MAWSAGDPTSYTPPLSLWKLVEQNVPTEEQDEIKSMLGTSLVEMTLDLHNEVAMLLEIYQNYQEEGDEDIPNMRPLAEPPHVRERLVQEICFLAQSVREKSLRKGMNPAALLARHNSQVLDYAEEVQRSGSSLGTHRPLSARASDGRQTPLSPSGQASSRSELSSAINKDVTSANDKLNYMQFGEVCTRLRETLTREMEQLESDVLFLQDSLDCAADSRSRGASPSLSREPTITELREERSYLEKELLSTQALPTTPTVNKPAFLPSHTPAAIKMQSLGPVSSKLRPSSGSSSRGPPGRSAPLRATHHHPSPPSSATHRLSPPTSGSASPVSPLATPTGHQSPTNHSAGRTGRDLRANTATDDTNSALHTTSQDRGGRHGYLEGEDIIRRRDGSGSRRRTISPARVKVVPVGSILDPHGDVLSGRPFMPSPPPDTDKAHLPRPSSADRFRKLVLQHREAT